ncbi:Zinc/iron permease [Neocallimastix californiae]|uniref:Zinc/iron permease n=1 Tax=Neocallimastix californiae TaxID=1754190 RepID=A0A1Y2C944_9FUNG|nr:Zinc/iron permease [Neocallimastix californiae]|eukprot:ORY43552.1 Zinc/iron permease [Neocallimastix californiae]
MIAILTSSLLGTMLPVLLKNKPFFKEDSILFGSVKLFGIGIILGVAFIHMLSPANALLTSAYTFKLFNEEYISFAGVFAIFGIIIAQFIQVYTSHFLERKHNHDHLHVHTSSEFYLLPAVHEYVATQHEILHLMEKNEKQLVCYLLEIGISFHSILIGIAFGIESSELVAFMIAIMFHQFFEGVSLSSVFIEAHFKHIISILYLIIFYCFTIPLGGIIGLTLRSYIESATKIYVTIKGIIDSMASGLLIYDVLVNILNRHCSSCNWKNTKLYKKNIQLLSFYFGLFINALIGKWT